MLRENVPQTSSLHGANFTFHCQGLLASNVTRSRCLSALPDGETLHQLAVSIPPLFID